MKCKLYRCDNEATGNYPCCSMDHGIILRMQKKQINDCFDADDSRNLWGTRELYTIEMAEYYI